MNNSGKLNPENILCPVDFSDLSSLAIKYAAAGARVYGAKLILMHAGLFELPRYFSRGETERLADEIVKTKEMIRKELSGHFRKVLGNGVEGLDVEFDVIEMDPGGAIIEKAEQSSAGLIVMGTHGLTGIKRMLLGSVAESVIHNAVVPVFTVRQKSHDFIDVTDTKASPRLERILCACEITGEDRATIDYAVSIAERFNARLTVLYIDESQEKEDYSRVRERICGLISGEAGKQCDLEPVVKRGNAADQIIIHAKEEKSDLVVIGARHRPFHDAMILGRTTDLVVRHAPAPVLVIPGIKE